jgi:hypothetical protein
MVRSIFAGVLAAALLAGPAMALAQTTDMVTYADTLRKKGGSHSAVRPVTRGPVSSKHAASAKHAAAKAGHAGGKARHHK